jgi:hypothetical protein
MPGKGQQDKDSSNVYFLACDSPVNTTLAFCLRLLVKSWGADKAYYVIENNVVVLKIVCEDDVCHDIGKRSSALYKIFTNLLSEDTVDEADLKKWTEKIDAWER